MGRWAVAVEPPPRLKTSDWAEEYRTLPAGASPVPGRWLNATAPYLRWLMDAPDVPGLAQLVICKAAQIGVSEAFRNVIGARAHQDPEPVGLALPNRDKGEEIMVNRLHPLFTSTAPLRALHSGMKRDLKKGTVRLPNGFILHLMWAGSPSSMASDPMRLIVLDEVDKMVEWSGKEADPVSLTGKRLRAYRDRGCQVCISTPTTRVGKIWRLFEGSATSLYYHVPCPRCGEYIRLLFPMLEWMKDYKETPELHAADVLANPDETYYKCQVCEGRIDDSEKHAAEQAGQYRVLADAPAIFDAQGERHDCAETVEEWPRRSKVGVQISALYCLWTKWADIVAEHISATDMPARYDFKCQTLGLPFDHQVSRTSSNVFHLKSLNATAEQGVAPAWTRRLIATVDTQADYFYAVLRAWGANLRSQRVWHGRLETFKDIDDWLYHRTWPIDGQLPQRVHMITIDSGGTQLAQDAVSRTVQVYRYAHQRRDRVRALKGTDKPRAEQFLWYGKGFLDIGAKRKAKRRPHLRLLRVVTNYWADILADMIAAGTSMAPDRPEQWLLNRENDPEYNRHMASVAKIIVKRGSQILEEWLPLTDGARIDFWHCEVYNVATAYLLQLHNLIEAPADEDDDDYTDGLPAPTPPAARERFAGSFYDA